MLLATLSGCPSSDPALAAAIHSPQQQQLGRRLFVQHCALCHGVRADGHGTRRTGFKKPPTDFTDPGWRQGMRPEQVFDTIRNGVPNTAMAAWRSLSDDQLRALTAYVLAVSQEEK